MPLNESYADGDELSATDFDSVTAQVNDNATDIASLTTGKQDADADLTAIAGLSPTDDDVLQRKAGAWTNRTMTQLKTDLGVYSPGGTDVAVADGGTGASSASAARTNLGLAIGTDVEAHDADLTAIAGLSPTNDDVLQRKAGAWTNRTIAQLRTDLNVYSPGGTDVAVADGGTGVSTLTGIVKGNGTSAFTAASAGTDYVAPGGALGTPSSGDLSNCTFPTLNQNTTGSAAKLTTARNINGVAFDGTADITLTPRASTTASSATPTINTDNIDMYGLTAQAVDITSMTTNLSGTPVNGQKLWIYIVGTAARAITWGASFEAGPVALPTTTVTTQRLDVGFVWNAATSKWRCVASGSG